ACTITCRRKKPQTFGSNFLRRHYPDQVQGDPKLLFASISAEDAPQRPCFYVQKQYSKFVGFVKSVGTPPRRKGAAGWPGGRPSPAGPPPAPGRPQTPAAPGRRRLPPPAAGR